MERRSDRPRLMAMMFGHYLMMGSWAVTISTWLRATPTRGGMGFSSEQSAWTYACFPLAGLITPFVLAPLSDRFFAAQRLLAVTYVIGAALLLGAVFWSDAEGAKVSARFDEIVAERWHEELPYKPAERSLIDRESPWREQVAALQGEAEADPEYHARVGRSFRGLWAIMLCYCVMGVAGIILTNLVAMRSLEGDKARFARIRLWGTVGWVVAGFAVGYGLKAISWQPLAFAAACSAGMAVLACFLPHTPPKGGGRTIGDIMGVKALTLFRDHGFAVVIVAAVLISMVQQFYSVLTNPFLDDLNPSAPPAALQTLAQVLEIVLMACLPWVVRVLGLKWTMALGLFGWVVRNGVFMLGDPAWVLAVGLPSHGVSYVCFWTVVTIYADVKAPEARRGAVQSMVGFAQIGLGSIAGSLMVAATFQANTARGVTDWHRVWLLPTVLAGLIFVAFVAAFRSKGETLNDSSPAG